VAQGLLGAGTEEDEVMPDAPKENLLLDTLQTMTDFVVHIVGLVRIGAGLTTEKGNRPTGPIEKHRHGSVSPGEREPAQQTGGDTQVTGPHRRARLEQEMESCVQRWDKLNQLLRIEAWGAGVPNRRGAEVPPPKKPDLFPFLFPFSFQLVRAPFCATYLQRTKNRRSGVGIRRFDSRTESRLFKFSSPNDSKGTVGDIFHKCSDPRDRVGGWETKTHLLMKGFSDIPLIDYEALSHPRSGSTASQFSRLHR